MTETCQAPVKQPLTGSTHDRSPARSPSLQSRPSVRRAALASLVAAWVVAVAVSVGLLWRYSNSPSPNSSPPARWPAGTGIARSTTVPTLVMFAHPRCPCTRASIHELAVVMRYAENRLAADVVFLRPTGMAVDWERTDLWDSAADIPGAILSTDPGGVEAARFGAKTSGSVLVYGPDGRLLFDGGITGARGHEGSSDGRAAILALLSREPTHSLKTPVYGCDLFAGAASCSRPSDGSLK